MTGEGGTSDFELSDGCFEEYLVLIHRLSGITIAKNRKSMIHGRLKKRIVELGLTGFPEYLDHVKMHSAEKMVFVDLVTTNETYFFRTPRVWQYLESTFLPSWHAKHARQTLRIWSAASSSGEEAHSVAILCQNFKSKNPVFQYQVTGTDISEEMVALAQSGGYSGRSIENFRSTRPELFKKYMQEDGDIFKASPEIRAQLKFQQHNLFAKSPFKNSFDLILLRNVLIYFSREDQERALANIQTSLSSDGLLVIGESESLSYINSSFKSVAPLFYSRNAA